MAGSDDLGPALKAEALRLGFDWAGIAPAVEAPGHSRLLDWLDAGKAAGMAYMPRQAEARRHPESVLPGVRSILVVALVYGGTTGPASDDPSRGRVARYAQGRDYHEVFWRKLETLLAWVRVERPESSGRAVADTAPLAERDFARLAGMGWIGKNTMLISPKLGSFTLLGSLLLDLDLEPDAPFEADRCGTCTRCMSACPTDAFDGPGLLDANRCLSYWTIEHKGAIPDEVAHSLDGWAFGCDVCQDVCPWNRKAPAGRDEDLRPREDWVEPDLVAWLDRPADEWSARLKGTAQKRSKRSGLIRNAALILGSRRVERALPALERLRDDPDPTIRGAVRWALRRFEAGENAPGRSPGTGEAGPSRGG